MKKEIAAYGKVEKVWICGPPIVNEQFDKVFEKNLTEFNMKREDYDPM